MTELLANFLEKKLLPDLQERARLPAVRAALQRRWEHEKSASRTAEKLDPWMEHTLEQVGAAWILSCVFLRTLEDRGLLAQPRIAGGSALDSEGQFYELAPHLSAREYLLTAFREVSRFPGAKELLGPAHNPAWRLSPSSEVAGQLLELFRSRGDDGQLLLHFGGDDTRLLGDLYQDLSAAVRARYALLQTPRFVESFILDLTLEPAIREFGLEQVRLIDPTCGSGHFLLGAFDRLFEQRQRAAPGADRKELAGAALQQLFGVDLNPYAVAIARFRLTLSYLQKAGIERLAQAPGLHLNLVVADSLLHGARNTQRLLSDVVTDRKDWGDSLFTLEDETEAARILGQRYHAVVGNPPYITCKDAALRETYRKLYPKSAAGKYALAAPFTERFFQLALDQGEGAGFVGLINANSFMKREFGKKLIEEVLSKLDLQRVIDTSGAYIPGHGTPTVLLFGRNRGPQSEKVRAVLGKRGEPSTPEVPQQGRVWSAIAEEFDLPTYENDFISVAEVERTSFDFHPWSLGGGGAAELKELIEERAETTLGQLADSIGITSFTLEDDVYIRDVGSFVRAGANTDRLRPMVVGEAIRDWSIGSLDVAFFPYDRDFQPIAAHNSSLRTLWPFRTGLSKNILFGGKTKLDAGLHWFEYGRLTAEKLRTPLSIVFAEVATHNHFMLDRGGKVFKQTAPIIKLPSTATEDEHFGLLGYLNSSAACFYLRQTAMNKGGSGIGRGLQDESWEHRHAFNGATVAALPFKASDAALVQRLISLAESRRGDPRGEILERMVALQERLDFELYKAFGLIDEQPEIPERIAPGSRFFEVQMIRDGVETAWFERHGYQRPTGEETALEDLNLPKEVLLMEQPEYKRRWILRDHEAEALAARRTKLAEAIEAKIKARSAPASLRALAQEVVTELGEDLLDLAMEVAQDDCVPFHVAFRFKDSGMDKRAKWEHTWELQRREDKGEKIADIEVPPRYGSKDYRDATYWKLRGKLDVPKERFISYPGCEKEGDSSPLIGWAGWDHLQRAQALATLYGERKNEDGWDKERLVPMLAGLEELLPWLLQWHNDEVDGAKAGDSFVAFVETEARALHLTREDLRNWRPPAKAKARRKAALAAKDS